MGVLDILFIQNSPDVCERGGGVRERVERVVLAQDIPLDKHWENPAAALAAVDVRHGTFRCAEGGAEAGGGDTNMLGDGFDSRAIVLSCLFRETKEGEEDDGANNDNPTGHFKR